MTRFIEHYFAPLADEVRSATLGEFRITHEDVHRCDLSVRASVPIFAEFFQPT